MTSYLKIVWQKKTIKLHDILTVVRSIFNESKKSYPQDFLDDYLYKLWNCNIIELLS